MTGRWHSTVYAGQVTHTRFAPRRHRLRYGMFQLMLDLDEAHELSRKLTLFSVNRFNLFSHFDADHGEGEPGALRAWVEEVLHDAGMPIGHGRILLLAMPRLLGHLFNPLSIYFCHRPDGDLAAMIYEVNNTFGERHWYVIAVDEPRGQSIRQSCAKAFRVSPFLPLAMTYDFELSWPGESLRTSVVARDPPGRPVVAASFQGERRDLNDAGLLRLLAGFPFQTLKVVAAIYLEAIRLWLKGVRIIPSPSPSASMTVVSASEARRARGANRRSVRAT